MLTVDPARAGVTKGARVLDVGCGGGRHVFGALSLGAAVVAFDRSESELSTVAGMLGAMAGEAGSAPADAALVRGDAGTLPFASASFDVVIASEVLEHIEQDGRAIAELVRVLRPGGHLGLSVPRAGPEAVNWALSSAYHEVEGGHVRIYRRRALVAALESAGLALVGRDYRHGLHSPYWWLRCAVGLDKETHRLVAAYHRLLVWEIERRPLVTRLLGRALDPVIGKSLVLYLRRLP